MRQIILDTETTGLEPSQGHRIIEIGCVELINRKLTGNHYHQYLQPEREIDQQAIEVHGITNEFLSDKPLFSSVVDDFMTFVDGAELIIHNAPFDTGFIDHELKLHDGSYTQIHDYCLIIDTLLMARSKHPGQKNSLDALCKRYGVDNSQRDLHGALLDAEILADVYLLMTGGQTSLSLSEKDSRDSNHHNQKPDAIRRISPDNKTVVLKASDDELAAHRIKLDSIDKASGGQCLWKRESG